MQDIILNYEVLIIVFVFSGNYIDCYEPSPPSMMEKIIDKGIKIIIYIDSSEYLM